MSPAGCLSPKGKSPSLSSRGQSPSPAGVSPSPLDQSPSPVENFNIGKATRPSHKLPLVTRDNPCMINCHLSYQGKKKPAKKK